MTAFYNDNELYAAEWLRNLAKNGLVMPGTVDERSIKQITATDISGFKRCHFFAGIGGWELALQFAGWPTDESVWTGSCPCQPFSVAGKRKGTDDERHLWPYFRKLIDECRPAIVFGEQVASKGGRQWLSGVRADLEALGYAVGAADLCAAGVEAPHIRQRLYWVAYSGRNSAVEWLGNNNGKRCSVIEKSNGESLHRIEPSCGADANGSSFWSDYDLIPCADGKTRRIESGTFPLADGISARVGKLRAYGNAIVPQVAAEFIKAAMDAIGIGRLETV